jgi:hypothetical protein
MQEKTPDPFALVERSKHPMQRYLIGFAFVLFTGLIPAAAQVNGSGKTHFIPAWTGSNTLGDSILFETNGMVGLGTTTPKATLTVIGQNGPYDSAAPPALQVIGGKGSLNYATRKALAGGPIQLIAGPGASGGLVSTSGGGLGGNVSIGGGGGGSGLVKGGVGGLLQLQSGAGGGAGVPPTYFAVGGSGAVIELGPGYPANLAAGSEHGGDGGSISLLPGAGGTFGQAKPGTEGRNGDIYLAPNGGNVGIGTSSPRNTLEVAFNGTTLADSWTTRSSRRFKTNIQPLIGALEKVTQLQGVSYDRKEDGKHEIGVVAEDVEQIVPEIVARDPETREVQGVDYARVSALLIEAIKAQQAEIQQLRALIQRVGTQTSVQ